GATLYVSNQIGGIIGGKFHDMTTAMDIPVKGQLSPLGPPKLDAMSFHGSATMGALTEQVVFNGEFFEGPPPLMVGQLTEHYALPIAMWTTNRVVESYGRPLAGVPGAAPLDPALATPTSAPGADLGSTTPAFPPTPVYPPSPIHPPELSFADGSPF